LNQTERYVDVCFPLDSTDEGFKRIAWGTPSAKSPELQTDKLHVSTENNGLKRVPGVASPYKGTMQEKVKSSAAKSTDEIISNALTLSSDHLTRKAASRQLNRLSERITERAEPLQIKTKEVRDESNHRSVVVGDKSASEEWRLPTPTSSSDEESPGEEEEKTPPQILPETLEDNFSLPSQDSSSDESDAEDIEMKAAITAYSSGNNGHARLPTNHFESSGPQMRSIDTDQDLHKVEAKVDIAFSRSKAQKRRVLYDSPDIAVFARGEPSCGQQQSGGIQVDEIGIAKKKRKESRRVFEDSPERDQINKRSSIGSESIAKIDPLIDTQLSPTRNDVHEDADVDVVCGVCLSGDWVDEDPILLCDGSRGSQCNVAVHTSCYSVACDWRNEEEWRCEGCQYRHDGGSIKPKCYICCDTTGPLSRFLGSEWIHLRCKNAAEQSEPRMELGERSDLVILPDRNVQKRRRKIARAIRKDRYASFFDEEAKIASGDEVGGDETDEELARDIAEEEEEFHKDFINDSTQLGYATQDDLDRLGEVEQRAFDTELALKNAYATPVLNRQMRQPRGARWSDVNETLPASLRGVGQMHFIRSVIEHHRQGGDADQIEQAYKEIEMQATPADEQQLRRVAKAAAASNRRKTSHFPESDSE